MSGSPSRNDCTYVVTGANSGVGRATTERLAGRGATVFMLCRSRERGQRALDEIRESTGNDRLRLGLVDLGRLDEVREVARKLDEEIETLDGLVNNAGVYRARREITEDGFERTMAVNHLAHYLLTRLLFDRLRAASGRVVTVASEGHRSARLRREPLEAIMRGQVKYGGWRAYADSKAANVLFTRELARRSRGSGVSAVAVHPGTLATRIWNQNNNLPSLILRLFKPFMGKPQVGGAAAARLALDRELDDVNGAYFDRFQRSEPASEARDPALARELWELSARLTGVERDWPAHARRSS